MGKGVGRQAEGGAEGVGFWGRRLSGVDPAEDEDITACAVNYGTVGTLKTNNAVGVSAAVWVISLTG